MTTKSRRNDCDDSQIPAIGAHGLSPVKERIKAAERLRNAWIRHCDSSTAFGARLQTSLPMIDVLLSQVARAGYPRTVVDACVYTVLDTAIAHCTFGMSPALRDGTLQTIIDRGCALLGVRTPIPGIADAAQAVLATVEHVRVLSIWENWNVGTTRIAEEMYQLNTPLIHANMTRLEMLIQRIMFALRIPLHTYPQACFEKIDAQFGSITGDIDDIALSAREEVQGAGSAIGSIQTIRIMDAYFRTLAASFERTMEEQRRPDESAESTALGVGGPSSPPKHSDPDAADERGEATIQEPWIVSVADATKRLFTGNDSMMFSFRRIDPLASIPAIKNVSGSMGQPEDEVEHRADLAEEMAQIHDVLRSGEGYDELVAAAKEKISGQSRELEQVQAAIAQQAAEEAQGAAGRVDRSAPLANAVYAHTDIVRRVPDSTLAQTPAITPLAHTFHRLLQSLKPASRHVRTAVPGEDLDVERFIDYRADPGSADPEIYIDRRRAPAAPKILFITDVSSSMSADDMVVINDTVASLYHAFRRARYTFNLWSFSDHVYIYDTPCPPLVRGPVMRRGTNADGVMRAAATWRSTAGRGRRCVVLLTDGEFHGAAKALRNLAADARVLILLYGNEKNAIDSERRLREGLDQAHRDMPNVPLQGHASADTGSPSAQIRPTIALVTDGQPLVFSLQKFLRGALQ